MTTTVRAAECPSCRSTFPIDPERVPEAGVHAHCSSCWRVFFVPPAVSLPVFGQEMEGSGAGASGEASAPVAAGTEAGGPLPEGDVETVEPVTWEREFPPGDRGELLEAQAQEAGEATDDPTGPTEAGERDEPLHSAPPELEAPPEAGAPPEAEAPPEPGAPAPGEPGGVERESTRARAVFGRRDPHDRAQRLARVLVSDMIVYHSDRHQRALQHGTLREEFDEEIRKSWEQYVEQVGQEMAEGTDYFREALNELLARGEKVF